MKAALALALVLTACDTGSFYAYTANQYDSTHDCVSDIEAIDIESGSDPGATCGAKCIVGPDVDGGGGVVYASTMCGPNPAGADVSGTDPQCMRALAALARGDFCLEGGTSTNPLDAGSD